MLDAADALRGRTLTDKVPDLVTVEHCTHWPRLTKANQISFNGTNDVTIALLGDSDDL
jgi:hypothetical protein